MYFDFMMRIWFTLVLAFTVRLAAATADDYWDDRFDALGMDGVVRHMAVHGDDVYVIGEFTMAGGVPANGLAKWDGIRWSALAGEPPPLNRIYRMAATDKGVFLTGSFTNSTVTNTLLNWNVNGWRPINPGPLETAGALASQDSLLYVGSGYPSARDPAIPKLATWDGVRWLSLPKGLTNQVTAIAFSDGVVFLSSAKSKR